MYLFHSRLEKSNYQLHHSLIKWHRFIAGIRTFATIYKANGEIDEWAKDNKDYLFKILLQKDKLREQINLNKKQIKCILGEEKQRN